MLEPEEHSIYKGFYKHPTLEDIYISHKGFIYDDRHRYIINGHDSNGYIDVSVNGNSYKAHRLVAETFLEKPKDIPEDKLIVNHKDGNKSNNQLENLEWTDYKGNNDHAVKAGLRSDNHPIILKDLKTKEIMEFPSIGKTAKHIGTHQQFLLNYLRDRYERRAISDRYIATYKDTPFPDEDYVWKCGIVGRDVIYILVTNDGEDIYAIEGLNQVADFVKCNYKTIKARFLKTQQSDIKHIVINGYKVYRLKDYPVNKSNETQIKKSVEIRQLAKTNNAGFKKGCNAKTTESRIRVTNLKTGESWVEQGITPLARKCNTNKTAMRKNIYQYKGIWKNLLKIEYLDSHYHKKRNGMHTSNRSMSA